MRWSLSRTRILSCAFGLLAAFASSAEARDFRGAVAGRVTGACGGALPGVTATVRKRDTNVTTDTVTNETGTYSLLYLQPGPYTASAELPGFRIELYNAFNDVFYNNPNLDPTSANFGLVSSQNNVPRNIQIGTKIVF